jgi:hypothetical protein
MFNTLSVRVEGSTHLFAKTALSYLLLLASTLNTVSNGFCDTTLLSSLAANICRSYHDAIDHIVTILHSHSIHLFL